MPNTNTAQGPGLFNEKELLSENQHKQFSINELPLNESVGFYFDNLKDATSSEYGDFQVCQGLEIDLTSQTVEELISKAVPMSFIPNTLLSNKITEHAMAPGECYRIAKKWDRGQKFKDGTKAKGYGFDLFHQEVGPQVKAQLSQAYKNALSGALHIAETDDVADANKPGLKRPEV